jgi:tetratricopeptide (TPR) repeat protein
VFALFKGWMDHRAQARRDKIALLEEALRNPAITHVRDAPVLLPQMVPLALPDATTLTGAGWDAPRVAREMRRRVAATATEREHGTEAILGAFERWIAAGLAPLLNDPAFVQQAAPEITREIFGRFDRMEGKLDNLGEQLNDIGGQTRDTLEAMALRFGAAEPEAMRLPDLKAFLIDKAKDYRALRAEVEAIDDGLKRLSNLKAAAKDAIDRGDLAEVETLLARVQEVELDEAARTAELRADTALLRGCVEQAFALLSAAADSFAGIDAVELTLRRKRYADLLYRHGLRYGGQGLSLSAEMCRAVLAVLDEDATPMPWATTQNDLAAALAAQGARSAGEDGDRLLGEAVQAYHANLRVRTEADHPEQWAMTMQNLGLALRIQSERRAGEDSARLLREAVDAFRASLRVRTEADYPLDWATTMMNLGAALSRHGERSTGADGARLLEEAVEAFRACLRVFTEADHPMDWAGTMQNLGVALMRQGERGAGEDGARLLGEALEAFRARLRVVTEADHPVQWAMTQGNIAIAEVTRAAHPACGDARGHLETALGHVEAALTVFDPEHMPNDHAQAVRLRDAIRGKLAAL